MKYLSLVVLINLGIFTRCAVMGAGFMSGALLVLAMCMG